MTTYFVKLSLIEEIGGGSMAHNLNIDVEAEDEIDAINKAIIKAFEDAHAAGHTISGIHVGYPREAGPISTKEDTDG